MTEEKYPKIGTNVLLALITYSTFFLPKNGCLGS